MVIIYLLCNGEGNMKIYFFREKIFWVKILGNMIFFWGLNCKNFFLFLCNKYKENNMVKWQDIIGGWWIICIVQYIKMLQLRLKGEKLGQCKILLFE